MAWWGDEGVANLSNLISSNLIVQGTVGSSYSRIALL
jgi:hypothetical protein